MATHTKSYQPVIIPPLFTQTLVVGMMLIFLLGGAYTGYLFYFVVKNTVKEVANRTNLRSVPYVQLALPLGALPITGGKNAPPLPAPARDNSQTAATGLTGAPLPNYERKERVNILLLGIDKRPDEVYARTDTMILVTIDPNTNTAGMLSIPRDLWVSIPGFKEDRINKAHFLGDQYNYPGGGPALAMKTVQYNLGVPVHFYIKADFDGFRKIVDTLGGIEVDVPETLDDPTFPDDVYGYDPFYIEAGHHTLDGYNALRYARTRHSAGSDFARSKRQQQVLMAIRDKALQVNIIPKIPELWSTLSGAFETNLQLVDIVELAQLGNAINTQNIKNATIGPTMAVDYTVPDTGAMVLLPVREKIQALINEIFTETKPVEQPAPAQPQVQVAQTAEVQARAQQIEQEAQRQEEIKQFLAQENARLVVQNGSNLPNLDSQTALYLKQQGFNILQYGPADANTYPHTVIVVYNDTKTYTLQVLQALFNVSEQNIRRSPNLKSDLDVRVIVGSDFQAPGSEQTPLTTTKP